MGWWPCSLWCSVCTHTAWSVWVVFRVLKLNQEDVYMCGPLQRYDRDGILMDVSSGWCTVYRSLILGHSRQELGMNARLAPTHVQVSFDL